MPNTYFKFKQFTVHHDLCAMKVNTDGVLLGAWAEAQSPQLILDIGSGSGLISLMLAQRYPEACILGIDINEGAYKQTEINFKNSPWAERLYAKQVSIQDFAETTYRTFDLIVSNPPYFENSLKNPSESKTLARHTDSLSHRELLQCAHKLLSPTGSICLILPEQAATPTSSYAQELGLHLARKTNIYPTPTSSAKRALLQFDIQTNHYTEDKLILEHARHQYSPEYKELTQNFYL